MDTDSYRAEYDWRYENAVSSIVSLKFSVCATPVEEIEVISAKLRRRFQALATEIFPRFEKDPQCMAVSVSVSRSMSTGPSNMANAHVRHSTQDSHLAPHDPGVVIQTSSSTVPTVDQNSQANCQQVLTWIPYRGDPAPAHESTLGNVRQPGLSWKSRKLRDGLLACIRDGYGTFMQKESVRLCWQDDIELLKPVLDIAPLGLLQNQIDQYRRALGFRKWLSDFLLVCAKVCDHGGSPNRQTLLSKRKFIYCIIEPINLLYPKFGRKAFHIITILAGDVYEPIGNV